MSLRLLHACIFEQCNAVQGPQRRDHRAFIVEGVHKEEKDERSASLSCTGGMGEGIERPFKGLSKACEALLNNLLAAF